MNSMLQDELKKMGYAQEEEYFYKLNRELIDRKRALQDQNRMPRVGEVKCPKCGGEMKENQIFQLFKKLFEVKKDQSMFF